ncbi:MAG: P1 family peptidase [Bacillota bacterium]
MLASERPRLRDLGYRVGELPVGPGNAITDVAGVLVGHVTLYQPELGVCTGVTALRPHPGNVFREKVVAAVHVINGYGKAMGLAQVAELGTLETPVVLTNTLSVGTVAEGLVRWMLEQDPGIGGSAGTVNPVVMECNDGYLNDIRLLAVRPEHVRQALEVAASVPPREGAVGAGTGMVCYGFKGGIGTASRVVMGEAGTFTLGVLVLANFGRRRDLTILGFPVGLRLGVDAAGAGTADARGAAPGGAEAGCAVAGDRGGSVIVVVATDAPLTSRQLGRLARRAVVGLARTGSYVGHSSGDFVLAFTTATRYCHDASDGVYWAGFLPDHGGTFSGLSRAVVEATEEAVLNALFRATTTRGRLGRVVEAVPVEKVLAMLRQGGSYLKN